LNRRFVYRQRCQASRRSPCLWFCAPLLLLVSLITATAAQAQGTASAESSLPLFTTLCALQAAGFESHVVPAPTDAARVRLRGQMLALEGPAVQKLREFYNSRRTRDSAAMLSRYITFALVAGPPPNFAFTLSHDQLPPDALALEGFNEILAAFYQEAGIEERWNGFESEYSRDVFQLREPLGQIVLVATTYAREILRTGKGPAFTVYVEPLVGARTSVRSFGDRYAIVLSPRSDTALDDIRHAYLHFLLDPIVIRHPLAMRSREPLLLFAAKAPRLSTDYKNDFGSLVSECLVKAVELRLAKPAAEKLTATLDEADREGFVLVRPFYRELDRYEQSDPGMGQYFPDLMRRISVGEEARRMQNIEFAAAAPAADTTPIEKPAVSETQLWLQEGDRQLAAENGHGAVELFARVLKKDPGHPRAVYGMAMASILLREPDRAKELFVQLLESGPQRGADARLLAWAHVYLGRIHDVEGKRELALSEYRAALAVEGAPEAARMAAKRGVETGFAAGAPRGSEKP